MRIGNRTLRPKRFDSFSKKTENLLGRNPLCQKSVAFLTVSYLAWGGMLQAVWSVWSSWWARWERGFSRYSA